jgi:hypothetical protein
VPVTLLAAEVSSSALMADWGLLIGYYGRTVTMRREDLEMYGKSVSCKKLQLHAYWVSKVALVEDG